MTGASMQSGMEQQVWGPLPTLLLRQGQPIITSRDDLVGSVSDIPEEKGDRFGHFGWSCGAADGPSALGNCRIRQQRYYYARPRG